MASMVGKEVNLDKRQFLPLVEEIVIKILKSLANLVLSRLLKAMDVKWNLAHSPLIKGNVLRRICVPALGLFAGQQDPHRPWQGWQPVREKNTEIKFRPDENADSS